MTAEKIIAEITENFKRLDALCEKLEKLGERETVEHIAQALANLRSARLQQYKKSNSDVQNLLKTGVWTNPNSKI